MTTDHHALEGKEMGTMTKHTRIYGDNQLPTEREANETMTDTASGSVTTGDQRAPMPSHTPGPWTIHEYGDYDAPTLVIHKDSATRVCFMATPGSHGDPARIEANAHLICAAPDMLAALKHARPFVSNSPYADRSIKELGAMLDAAIAKATGEQS